MENYYNMSILKYLENFMNKIFIILNRILILFYLIFTVFLIVNQNTRTLGVIFLLLILIPAFIIILPFVAISIFDMIKTFPSYIAGFFNRAGLEKYKNKKNYEKALIDFNRAIKIDNNPYNKNVYYQNLGFIFIEMDNYNEAIDSYKNAINIFPNDPLSYYNLGKLYIKIGDVDLADEYISKSKEIALAFMNQANELSDNIKK